MRVAVVHDWLTGMRGGERVLEAILSLFPNADIYTLFHFPDKVSDLINRHRIVVSRLQSIPGKRSIYRLLLPFFPSAIEQFDLKDYDLLISTSHAVAKGAVPGIHSLSVCYCHTPIRYIWDFFDQYFKSKERSLVTRFVAEITRDYLRVWDEGTTHRVHHFIANSRNVSRRIQRIYGRESTIIYPPVDTEFFKPISHCSGDYYLVLSALAPYKSIDLVIKAFIELKKPLVVIGSGQEENALRKLVKGTNSQIEFKGYIPSDAETLKYYQNCKALVFPGHEDFGLTPVEAQACGRPVIAFSEGGTLETVIEGISGHFFKKQSVDDLVKAVYEFECMEFDADVIRQRALHFDKKVMIRHLKAYFFKVLSTRGWQNDFIEV
ncbi:glycosyltransferase [bacterium]|nr:glycosyltransferase [candidate division CSSED10-310 bacterium]